MKAILEFDLPEDDAEHKLALQGSNLAGALHGFDERLGSLLKYGGKIQIGAEDVGPDIQTLQWVRDELWRILSDYDITELQ